MLGFLKKILGSKSDKDIKKLYPLVDKINLEYDKLKSLSDEELRGKTILFKNEIKNKLNDSQSRIENLKNEYKRNKGTLTEKEKILNEIDKIKDSEKEIIQNILDLLTFPFLINSIFSIFGENKGIIFSTAIESDIFLIVKVSPLLPLFFLWITVP